MNSVTTMWSIHRRSSFFHDPVRYVEQRAPGEDVVRFQSGLSDFTLVRDPEAIRRVLVADSSSYRQGKWKRRARRIFGDTLNVIDGADHRRRRILLQPALDRRRVASFAPMMVARTERLQAGWHDGRRLDIRLEINRLSVEIAGEVLFTSELEGESGELAEALMVVLAAVPTPAPALPGTRLARALERVDETLYRILRERGRSSESPRDLVGALIEGGVSERIVRGEMTAFLLAAVDEPPSALSAAWSLLARRPDAEARLHAELDAVLPDRSPSVDDLRRLPYLDAVMSETLRLHPPARYIDRCPVSDVRIDGQVLGAGSNLLLSPLVTHRDPRYFDDPAAFAPERWLSPPARERPRFAFFPFGAGPHTCIGEVLAMTEIGLVLATLGRRWRFRADPNGRVPDQRHPGLPVTLERR